MKANRLNKLLGLSAALCLWLGASAMTAQAAASADEREVRNVVNNVFDNLKNGNYRELYAVLPDAMQKKISQDKFVSTLARSRDAYELSSLEVGTVRVKGDLAVVDTVLYGRLKKPVESDGKIVVQQYLVREGKSWRVATGDNATINRFLKANPDFAKEFPIRAPQIYVKNERGAWIDVSSLARRRKK